MIEKLIIFVIFSFVKSSTDYPSTMIWDNFLLSLENGKIILPQNKKYFIFDESNYLNEDKNSKRMQKLYQRQKNVYDKNGIANYIFLVDYIDEDVENLEKCAKNINNFSKIWFFSCRIYDYSIFYENKKAKNTTRK